MAWLRILRRIFKEIGEDDISGVAAELAYKFFLALFPFLIFLTALASFGSRALNIDDPTGQIMDAIGTSLPPDATAVLQTQLSNVLEQRNTTLLSLGIIGTILAASSGMSTIMKTLNRIHEVQETRPFWKRYAISLGLTLTAGSFLIGSALLAVIGQTWGMAIASEIGMEGTAAALFTWGRWPVIIVLLLLAVAVMLWATPNVNLPFQWISAGAILFVAFWVPATVLFSFYVSNFGSYNATYGALGGTVVLLTWLYLTSFVLLVGAEVNDVLVKEKAPRAVKQELKQAQTADASSPRSRRRGLVGRASGVLPELVLAVPVILALLTWRRRSERVDQPG